MRSSEEDNCPLVKTGTPPLGQDRTMPCTRLVCYFKVFETGQKKKKKKTEVRFVFPSNSKPRSKLSISRVNPCSFSPSYKQKSRRISIHLKQTNKNKQKPQNIALCVCVCVKNSTILYEQDRQSRSESLAPFHRNLAGTMFLLATTRRHAHTHPISLASRSRCHQCSGCADV